MPRMKSILTLAITATLLSTQLGGGCVSDNGDSYEPPRRDDYRQDDYRRDEPPRGVIRLPRDARIVAEGRGTLRYQAPQSGRVFLFDAEDRTVIFDKSIRRGQEFIVSPKDDRAWFDDDRVLDFDLDRDRDYRIYYLNEAGDSREDRSRWDDRGEGRDPGRDREPSRGNADRPARDVEAGGPQFRGESVVPKSATITASGKNGDLRFSAAGSGVVYVYDTESKKVLGSYKLTKGQKFSLDFDKGVATIDGRQVLRQSFRRNVEYRLYFNLAL